MFSEQTLAANLAVITRVQNPSPGFARLDTASTRVTPSPTGGLQLELRTDSGAWVTSHSGPWPLATPLPDGLVVIGPALGQVLDALEAAGAPTRVVALEPDPGVALLMLARRDWRAWLETGRLRLLTGPDYRGAAACARMFDTAGEPQIVVNPTLAAHRGTHVAAARRAANRILADARANVNARRRFAGRYLLQTLTNLPVVQREANAAALDAAFTNTPAVVVGAGPSLDDNLPALRTLQDRVVIVAADTTLRPLMKGGVRPHLMVAVDPSELNARHLSGVGGLDDVWLAAEGSVHPSAFDAFDGRTFHFKVSPHEPWPWLASNGIERSTVRAWGSVVTSAFDVALRMGCNPIVFAGLDLAYTGLRPYCAGTIYHEMWQTYVDAGCPWERLMDDYFSRQPDVRVPDTHGVPTRTAPQMIAFRDWLLDASAAASERTIINATGGGILHGRGIAQGSIEEALAGKPRLGHGVRDRLRRAHGASITRPVTPLRAAIERLLIGAEPAILERWTQFTLGTVSPQEIRTALERSLPHLT